MIDKIKFKNFKLFKKQQELELRPITILIGKNSSGKSAVAKLPTMIEGALSGNFPEAILLENDGIELGGEYEDLVHGRAKGFLEFELTRNNESLKVTINADESTGRPIILDWRLSKQGNECHKGLNDNFEGFQCLDTPHDLSLITEYIGPFRAFPKRVYERPRSSRKEKFGYDGGLAYRYLIESALTTEQKLLKNVGDWYEHNFNGWRVGVDDRAQPSYRVTLRLKSKAYNVNIKDVGQGMSQALPLVTRALMPAEQETLLIFEQPELHLHPAAHANLAELFAESLTDKNKRYLIETHSQNFTLRIRRLVAEGKVASEDVLFYYVDFDEEKGESSLKPIEVDEQGKVDYWPEGVFSETLEETKAIRSAQLKR